MTLTFVHLYWLAAALLVLYWIAVIVAIIAENRDPTMTITWILLLALMPGVGLIVYFFVGRNWKGIHAKARWAKDLAAIRLPLMDSIYSRYAEYSAAVVAEYCGSPIERLIAAVTRERTNVPLPANDLNIWSSGAEYFPHLIEDISKAQKFVHMQYFVWEEDELTAKICGALAQRLNAGVEVRILHDFVGSVSYGKGQLNELKALGARVGSDVAELGRLNYRDHRKITVVDGVIGHAGGFNLGQEYIDGGSRFPGWRDTGMRLTGPAVAELQRLFADRWYAVYRESLYDQKYFPPADIPVAAHPIMTQVVAQGVEDYWSSSTRAYEIAISGAEKSVSIQSPYLVPDATMLDVLMNTALSGIDVKFMMTGLPDKKIAFQAGQSYWEALLRAGCHVYVYMAGFLHAKTIVIDDRVLAIGSMNLDVRSLRLNQELMVWIFDEVLARQQTSVFEADMDHCTEVTLADIESWSSYRRFINSASRLASNLL